MLNKLKFAAVLLLATSTFAPNGDAAPARLKKATIDQVLAVIMQHWHPSHSSSRAHGIDVEVRFELDRAGNILGKPKIVVRGGDETQRRSVARDAQRAVFESAPFTMLPVDKYESWRTIIARFQNLS